MNTYIKNMALVVALFGASSAYSTDGVCYSCEAEAALAEWEAFFVGVGDNDDYLNNDYSNHEFGVIVEALDMTIQVFEEVEDESEVSGDFDYNDFLDRLIVCATRKKVHIRDTPDDPVDVDLEGVSVKDKIVGVIDAVGRFFDKDVSAYRQRIEAHQVTYPA